MLGSAVLWWRMRDRMAAETRDAVGQMLVIGGFGLIGTFAQMRMVLLAV
ncbi:MAG: hypothetical protein HZT43_20465 [Exiguobacterium profundum]|nr:MAG: hypothetical protein HZT43_20465 [Exiguobacterium profundum]